MPPKTITEITDYLIAEKILDFDFETPRVSGKRKIKRPHFLNMEKLSADKYIGNLSPSFLNFRVTPRQILKAVQRKPFGIFIQSEFYLKALKEYAANPKEWYINLVDKQNPIN